MFEEGSVDDSDSYLHAVRDILSSHSSKLAPPTIPISTCTWDVLLTIKLE
jgi:hypothetical protein